MIFDLKKRREEILQKEAFRVGGRMHIGGRGVYVSESIEEGRPGRELLHYQF